MIYSNVFNMYKLYLIVVNLKLPTMGSKSVLKFVYFINIKGDW